MIDIFSLGKVFSYSISDEKVTTIEEASETLCHFNRKLDSNDYKILHNDERYVSRLFEKEKFPT